MISTMSDETPEERQNNELAVLQSIYGDAVADARDAMAWKVWRPLDLLLTLNPLHNSNIPGVHCSVTLRIKCSSTYPDKPPVISIHQLHGLSTENGQKLILELNNLAQKLCGEVMIFQLATHAQQFLHDHNKPILSFYEEMLKQKTEKEKLKLHDLQVKENEERQKIKDEVQKRQEILRVAGKQRVHRSSISQESSNDGQGDAPELVFYADERTSPAKKVVRSRTEVTCTCSSKGAQVLRVAQRNNKKVYIGNCLGHSSNGATTYLAIDDESGERLIAKKWSLPPASDFQNRNRQLTTLNQDFKSICRLKNSSLVPYTALEVTKEPYEKTVKQCVYVFRDFVLGLSLKCLKSKMFKPSNRFETLRLLRHVGLGVFSALKELHEDSVIHRDVRSENVFLDNVGTVKMVGASLDVILSEMFEGESFCEKQTKATDIYAAGQLLLSIISNDGSSHEIPLDLPTSAKDFFSRCLTEDKHSQWSAEQLISHGFLVDTPAEVPDQNKNQENSSESEDEDAVKKIHIPNPIAAGHSRLDAEFEVLKFLGEGAFGSVLKVKNKLDGGFYAIKRVQLNPENIQLNRKITREVKLLSRLNHENVVRYYNAWIETTTDCSESNDSGTGSVQMLVKTPISKKKSMSSLEAVVAKLGQPQEVKLEWSMSEGPVQMMADMSSDSEEDDDDDDEPGPWFRPGDDESSDIEFEVGDNESQTVQSEDVVDAPRPASQRLKQMLYIQMEFCEKHTLRQAIDSGLYQEHFRAWRLFREIVEGLAHVHQRGMIHRDLKPVNIFLDSNDHVKIGDFGLATKCFTGMLLDEKTKQEEISQSLTGQVGTALYVAPELLQRTSKMIYNQKVDIYSLGIILFEMFHAPLDTGMERMKVLTELRSKEITMPTTFVSEDNAKQILVIRWLLNHDASLRPTCAELLASEHVPRPVPEGALSGLLSHTLSDRGSRCYQRLIAACLEQRQSTAEDLTYHNGIKKPADVLARVKDAVVKVFRSHGATEFSPPLLTPRAKAWDQYPNAVKVMTSSGSVCHLPHDLRLPFARHVAYTGCKYMRRYVVECVYRERHAAGFHPKEMMECGFDILTNKPDSLWSDAELLVVCSRAIAETSLKAAIQINHTELLRALLVSCGVPADKHADMYPVLQDVSFESRTRHTLHWCGGRDYNSHTELLQALLVSCGVPADKHSDMYPVLQDVSLGRITSLQLQTHLTSLCVSNRDVNNLLNLMEADVQVYELKELVTPLVKQAKLSKIVCNAIHQLEAVYRNAKALGCDCTITVAPFLAYNATQNCGVFWQAAVLRDADNHKPSVKHRAGDLIAAGGRYDSLVQEFYKLARAEKDHDGSETKFSAVGFSMSLERMAAILKKAETFLPDVLHNPEPPLICVCVWGTAGSSREGVAAARRASHARGLWGAGLSAALWGGAGGGPQPHMEAAREACRAAAVLHQDDALVRVACYTHNQVREHRVPCIDVVDFIRQKFHPDSPRNSEGTTHRSMSWSEPDKSSAPNISVTFITASDRMTKTTKRHMENQIATLVTSTLVSIGLQPLLSRCRVLVVALACEAACVRLLSALLAAPLTAHELVPSFREVIAQFPKRKDILDEALEELAKHAKQTNQNRSSDETQLYALYSIPDSVCRLIT